MVIQTEIKARWIILLSISSYCWSTCLLRDENMRGKKSLPCATFLHIHLVFRVQCRELWQGLMVRTCPTVPSQGAGRLGARAGAPPALAIRHWAGSYTHGHVCILVAAIIQHRDGSQQAREVGTEKNQGPSFLSWELWHGISEGVAGEFLCFPARVISYWKEWTLESTKLIAYLLPVMLPENIFLHQMFVPGNKGKTRTTGWAGPWEQCPISNPTRNALEVPTLLRVFDGHLKDKCLTFAVSFIVWVFSLWT